MPGAATTFPVNRHVSGQDAIGASSAFFVAANALQPLAVHFTPPFPTFSPPGNAVEYEGSKFHQACFTCIDCGDVIAGDFIDRNGQPLCKPCKAKQQVCARVCAVCLV